MALPAGAPPMDLRMIAEARSDPARVSAALIWFGVILSAAALGLIVFKPPGGIFLRLHGGAPGYLYYGVLGAVVLFGLAQASFGYWAVPRAQAGWHAAGKTLLWLSLLPLVLVFALGGLAFLK